MRNRFTSSKHVFCLQGFDHMYAGSNLALNLTKMLLFNSSVIFFPQWLLAEISPKSFKSVKFSSVFGIQGVEIFPPKANVHENAGRENRFYLFLDICCGIMVVTKNFPRCLVPSLFAFNKLILKGAWETLKKPTFCPWKCVP